MKSIGTEFTKKLPRTMPSSPKYLTNTNKGIITQKGDYAMFKKLDKLEQDLTEVRGGLYDLKENTDLDFKAINILLGILEEAFEILNEDFKDHIETVKNFISDVR